MRIKVAPWANYTLVLGMRNHSKWRAFLMQKLRDEKIEELGKWFIQV
jgi:hypothetical protein